MIKVEGITKRFGPTLAVDDVSFEVNEGEVVGFIGPNGAGKSTTLRIITNYYNPDQGRISIAGHDIRTRPELVRQSLGYLPEGTPLYQEMGVVEYLTFLANVHGLKGQSARDRVDGIIETTRLTEMAHKDIGQLSRGYRQRVGLAQALIHDPPFLILDEPHTGLDPIQIKDIRELIIEIGHSKAILYSSHVLPEVLLTSTRMIIINRGRKVADGTLESFREEIGRDDATLEEIFIHYCGGGDA
jgi:ABC-2 type transport system ATP-binding protein